MERKAVNPWDWSIKLGYNQAEIIDGATRQLICAGQTGVDREGHPLHPGDMRGQIGAALDHGRGQFDPRIGAQRAQGGVSRASAPGSSTPA